MGDFRGGLLERLTTKHAAVVDLARTAMDSSVALRLAFGEQDVEQLVRAFELALAEALEGNGDATRRMLIETAAPAAMAQGADVADLIQVTATFGVLLTELVADLPEPDRRNARSWLASFMGDYSREMVVEAMR